MTQQMLKTNTILKRFKLILGCAALILIAFLSTICLVTGLEIMGLKNDFLINSIPRLTVGIILLWGFKKRHPDVTIGLTKEGWVLGLVLGWPIYIGSAINFYESLESMQGMNKIMPTAVEYVLYIVQVIAIGVFEEGMLRGVVLNKMLIQWGNTRRGIYASVAISSLLFGLIHLINLLSKPWLVVTTFTQVMYAFIIGIFFAAIYVRTRNLWVVIAFHALYDLGGCLDDLFIREISEKINPDISIMDGVMTLLPFMFFLVIALFYLRKEKLEVQERDIDKEINRLEA